MTTKVLYFDDEIYRPGRDAQKIQELLQLPGQFECELQPPPQNFSDLPPELPDAILVDLDLSSQPADGVPVSYFGSTLASEIRMRNPACPLIVISRPQILAWKTALLEESIDVDDIILKDQVNRDPEGIRKAISSLIEGFKILAATPQKNWQEILALMGANQDEANSLREAAPPLEGGQQWQVPRMARWIRKVIMKIPGILYDEITLATRLGITVESFRREHVQNLFKPAKYTGVFGKDEKRWWRGRVLYHAQSLMIEHNMQGRMSEKFREAYTLKFHEDLGPAVCVVDGTPTADWVCYVLKQPVKLRNSIPYYPDNRPPVMDQARVSFKAIQESNDFDENLVDADSYNTVVEKLWE